MQILRQLRTSMGKKRKRVEPCNSVGDIEENVPNVVIRWKNWWAYEGEEDRDLEKLIDKRKTSRRCEKLSRSSHNLNDTKASSLNEEEFSPFGECDEGLHKVETNTSEGLNIPKSSSFNERAVETTMQLKYCQTHLEESIFSCYKENTGLECLKSAYSGRSEEYMEENYSLDEDNHGLLNQCTEENLQQIDSFRLQDAMIVLPSSSTSTKIKEIAVNKSCRDVAVDVGDQVRNQEQVKKVVDDVTQNRKSSQLVATASNGNSTCHTNIRITGTQTFTMKADIFEYILESGQGTGHSKRRCSKASVENSKELKSAFCKIFKDIVMECPICKMPLHGDVDNEDDIRKVNRHIDACLSRCEHDS